MQKASKIERTGRIIMRTPILPLKNIYNPLNLTELLQDKLFLAALFIASPILYEEVLRYKDGKIYSDKAKRKIEQSLTKYYLRMSSRSTPFGLFSACGSLQENDKFIEGTKTITLPSKSRIKRYSRLDMNYLCALSLYISKLPEVILEFKFFSNTSLYSMGNKWRYVEYYYSSGNRIHQISSVDQDSIINNIIKESQKGIMFSEVKNIVKKTINDCSDNEILEFFKDLIGSNILISELEPPITGDDFLNFIISKLEGVHTNQISHLTNILREVSKLLYDADMLNSFENLVDVYKKITILLREINIEIDESKLFQVDSFWELGSDQYLDNQICSDINLAVSVLQKISPAYPSENLINFVQKFTARYEDQEIPIMQVLDTESGIGYVQKKKSPNSNQNSLKWGIHESLLYSKLQDCLLNKQMEIRLDEKDLETLKIKHTQNNLAPSFNALFRVVQKDESEGHNILVENLGGSSAANILGRFAYSNTQIFDQIRDICIEEERVNPNVVFAEIIHLPQSRVGNILLHPPFRKVEIPYISLSSLPYSNQIQLKDLLISIKNGKIILRSKKLNKVIVPRLSNAHNFSAGSQPVYHFLCDLQFQNIRQWLGFGWGDLAIFNKFLPRISYKNIILQPAIWNFRKEDINKYLNKEKGNQYQNFKNFCENYNIPTVFLLSDGDNDLPVNIKDKGHIDLFLNTIEKTKRFTLKEFLAPSIVLQDESENVYNNQFVASYIKRDTTYNFGMLQKQKNKKSLRRNFNQDSEWIYFKIYCGVKTSNDILRNSIFTCVNKLVKNELIDNWFFIRYADPDNHIRIRFHMKEIISGNREEIMSKLIDSIKHYEKAGLIWNIMTDTYKREIERYGDVLEYAEKLFSFDSYATINFLRYNNEDHESWWMYGLKAIDQTFNDFYLTLNERQFVMNMLFTSFNTEFEIGKSEKKKLDVLYRERNKLIYNIIENVELSDDQKKIKQIVTRKSSASKITIKETFADYPSVEKKKARIMEFLPSYIHMLMNRLCMDNARHEEMIMYNMLMRYYTSKIARIKYN